MEIMMSIEEFEGNIPEFEHTNVVVNEHVTFNVINILEGLLSTIGTIQEVVHYRQVSKIKYVTYIKGKEFDVLVKSGLRSGGVGTGVGGFSTVLQKTGISKDESERIAHMDSTMQNAVITIKYF